METKPAFCPAIVFSENIIREAGIGKLTIINSFQHFNGPEFPFVSPPFVVTAAFTNLSGKLDALKVSVEVVDEKNEALTPAIVGEFGSDRDVEPDDVFDLSFLVPSCSFEKEGVYQVLFIGDEVLGRRSLPVRLSPTTNTAPAPPTAITSTKAKGGKSPGRRTKKANKRRRVD
jgi:Family of unknown function (DUF6941)